MTIITITIFIYAVSMAGVWIFFQKNYTKTSEGVEYFFQKRSFIDTNLRLQIVKLQKKIVNLPKIFTSKERSLIFDKINTIFTVESSEKISDRATLANYFTRNERTDIFLGKILAKKIDGKLLYSFSIINEDGESSDLVQINHVQTNSIDADFNKLNSIINSESSLQDDKMDYEKKINRLKQICIDSAFESEKTRLEFVSNEQDVAQINKQFIELYQRTNKEWLTLVLAVFSGSTLGFLVLGLFSASQRRTLDK